jgi:hypothetical protein
MKKGGARRKKKGIMDEKFELRRGKKPPTDLKNLGIFSPNTHWRQ